MKRKYIELPQEQWHNAVVIAQNLLKEENPNLLVEKFGILIRDKKENELSFAFIDEYKNKLKSVNFSYLVEE